MGRAAFRRALAFVLSAACLPGGTMAPDSSDAGADADADADADTDLPPTGGWPRDPPPSLEGEDPADGRGIWSQLAPGACLDGSDDSDEELRDCESGACLARGACCQDLGWAFGGGSFAECEDLAACGWQPFGDLGASSPAIDGPWLVLGGSGQGEAGLATGLLFGLEGTPTLAFVASLDPEGCVPGDPCRAALGVALSSQAALSGATGVEPALGIVLDGELEAARLLVAGRAVGSVPVPASTLAERRTYAFGLDASGRAAFWVALPVAGEALPEEPGRFEPDLLAEGPDLDLGAPHRLAVWGRLDGDRSARLSGLAFEAWTCEVPGRFDRLAAPVRTAVVPEERAAGPSVVLIPPEVAPPLADDAPSLLMLFETAFGLAAATSWQGDDWRFVGRVLLDAPPTRYGRVARRSPALARWARPGEEALYHLWFDGVAEAGETAILHATSVDGLQWLEAPGGASVALEGDPSVAFRRQVGQPAVVEDGAGGLIMWFVGRDPRTGATALGRAASTDGEAWQVDEDPVRFEPAGPAAFELDGLSDPAVVRRGSVYHLWYVGASGARSAVGYGTAADGEGRVFERHGRALGPLSAWEGQRLGGPAVLELPARSSPGATLHLWYAAGPAGRESVGLARRWAPSR